MRAQTITTINRARRNVGRVPALVLGICALAIPATASGYAVTGDDPTQSAGGSEYSSVNSIAPPTSEPSPPGGSGGSSSVDSGYASLNSITGAPASEPTLVSGSPADPSDGFDWLSAAVGAGTAMALVALAGAAFLTVRRRPTASPSAASMS